MTLACIFLCTERRISKSFKLPAGVQHTNGVVKFHPGTKGV